MRQNLLYMLLILTLASTVRSADYAVTRRHPVYVGVKVCAKCHSGKGIGDQHSKWLMSSHAQAYAVLALPEAKEIADLSGIPIEPQESTTCLGCHATASEAEDWEKDDTFFTGNGIQCERCHGPGSEYIAPDVMRNRDAAVAAGLKMPKMEDCLNCHRPKASHVWVHKKPPLDMNDAMKRIEHSTPEKPAFSLPLKPPAGTDDSKAHKYTGAEICADCHSGPEMGYQYSKWRMSAHAQAFAVLASEKAYDIARDRKLPNPPQESAECLKCHSTAYHDPAGGAMDTYSLAEGVNCEACHGPGSDYSPEEIMKNPEAAKAAGLMEVTRAKCIECHADSHDKPFDFETAFKKIAHPTEPVHRAQKIRYKTPINAAVSPDGKYVYVTCEAGDSVIIVDADKQTKIAEVPVGRQPSDVTFSPDGKIAYVSNRLDDSVSVIDVSARKVIDTFGVGDDPHGLLTDASGQTLYVLNTAADSISVVDTKTLKETKRLSASRNPWSLAMSPDGKTICVTNTLSRFVEFRTPPISEVTMIDTDSAVVTERAEVPAANLLQGIHWHPDGEFAFATGNRTKNLVPMTRLLQGWTITNSLAIVWKDGTVDQVLLDEPTMCFPDPADVIFTPDGKLAFVTSSGTDKVAVIDVPKLISMLKNASDYDRNHVFPNHLGKPTEYIIKRIEVKNAPRGITVTPDGKTVFVVNTLDDSLTAIDVEKLEATKRIDLGGPTEITKTRLGERIFHSADIAFQRQFSCHTCHPDGHVDGLTYDIEPDGIGFNPVDNRTLRGILDTDPFKWTGKNPTLQRQCGPRLAVFFTRIAPFTPEQLAALEYYICTIPRPPNRYRPLGADLTDAQRRGKEMFYRAYKNDGSPIPVEKRCSTCHFPPLYTDRRIHDVGSKYRYDTDGKFDAPHLTNIYDSAPYMHNGMAPTLEEIWTKYNPDDTHGVTNDMTKDQLNDLVEYLKTL